MDYNKLWKSLQEVGIPDYLTCLGRNLNEGQEATEFDMEQLTGSKLEKVSFHSSPKKGNAKECSNRCTIALISHAGKFMPQILQASLQQDMNWELPDVQTAFRKGRGSRDQIANIHCIIEKAREFKKNIYFCFVDYAKAMDCVDHNKLCGKFLKRWEYQPTCLLRNLSVD